MGGEDSLSFSVELKSKKFVKSFTLSNKGREGVLTRGSSGSSRRSGYWRTPSSSSTAP